MPLSDYFPGFEGWKPVSVTTPAAPTPSGSSNAPGPSQTPTSDVPASPYLRAPLPLPMQYQPDTLKQSNRPGLSFFRIAPLPPGGIPAINSAAGTVVHSSITEFQSIAAAGPNGAIQFNNGGALGGVSQLEYLSASNTVAVNGNVSITGSLTLTGTLTANIFNALTGFQVAGAATLGNYLRGNGTDFVSAALSGSDISTGIVGVTFGGTGSNLSATGGTSEVLRQSTVGGNITVSQLAASDLSNGTTGTGLVVLATAPTINGLTFPTASGDAVVVQLIASGTAILGTSLIGSTSSATAVTVAASGVLSTDSIEWAFDAAPGTGYTSGLFVQVYVTPGNVNFVVTNPTAGSLTPAAATLNWRVIR